MQFDNFPNLSTPGDRIIHQLIIISSKSNIRPEIVICIICKYLLAWSVEEDFVTSVLQSNRNCNLNGLFSDRC